MFHKVKVHYYPGDISILCYVLQEEQCYIVPYNFTISGCHRFSDSTVLLSFQSCEGIITQLPFIIDLRLNFIIGALVHNGCSVPRRIKMCSDGYVQCNF